MNTVWNKRQQGRRKKPQNIPDAKETPKLSSGHQ